MNQTRIVVREHRTLWAVEFGSNAKRRPRPLIVLGWLYRDDSAPAAITHYGLIEDDYANFFYEDYKEAQESASCETEYYEQNNPKADASCTP